MTSAVPDVLSRIVETKREEVNETRSKRRPFRQALAAARPAIIAEIKKASPSKGVLAEKFDPAAIARLYESSGATALSVLTDRDYFQGALCHLQAARDATALPVLRKDFIIDETQIAQAFAAGADAILLIAAILSVSELRRLRESVEALGLDALVEAHNEEELLAALDSGATLVGINNRNLHTFEVTLDTSLRLAKRIPANVLSVSESGINSRDDVHRLLDAGYSAFLVGEQLMKSPDPATALQELLA
jgi:indole-3-glycerol phosphate synthase